MDELAILRTFAACTTIFAAAMVAANINARITVAGFAIFIVASVAWMADGWLENKSSLVIQNLVLLLINSWVCGAGCQGPTKRQKFPDPLRLAN